MDTLSEMEVRVAEVKEKEVTPETALFAGLPVVVVEPTADPSPLPEPR